MEKQPLTAGKALSTLALFNIMAIPLVLFSLMTSTLIMANVSASRLVPYFLLPEVDGTIGAGAHSDTIHTEASETFNMDDKVSSCTHFSWSI